MKTIFLLFCLLIFSLNILAQQSSVKSDAKDLKILGKKWYLTVPESGAGDGYLQALKDQVEAGQDISDTYNPYPASSPRLMNPKTTPVSPAKIYQYELKIKNTGQKTIRKIAWEYTFLNSATNERIDRIHFTNSVNLKPGETQKITQRTTLPPPKKNSVNHKGKTSKITTTEQVYIRYIE